MRDRAAILGAGLAGLSTAQRLAAAGVDVHLFERLPHLGGLARNVQMGGFTFDLGGHRFFSTDPAMIRWIEELLGDGLLKVGRRSRIYLDGRFFHYPLKPGNAMLGFGVKRTARIMLDYLSARIGEVQTGDRADNFEDWVVSRFGRSLYEIYFKPYTEKTWNLPPTEISADWASSRIQLLGLFDAVLRATFRSGRTPRTYAGRFLYPKGGIGRIAAALAEKIEAAGGVIHRGREVVGLRHEGNRVRAALIREPGADVEVEAGAFVSTMPVTDLVLRMDPPAPTQVQDAARMLAYRALVCVFLIIDAEKISDDTWIYFPDRDLIFGRSHEPRNWERDLSLPGMTSLCMEIFCGHNDRTWLMDDKSLGDLAVRDLVRTGLVTRGMIQAAFIERVPDAYPVFRVGYERSLKIIRDYLSGFANLRISGRTGTFSYLNMDQVASGSLSLAEEMLKG